MHVWTRLRRRSCPAVAAALVAAAGAGPAWASDEHGGAMGCMHARAEAGLAPEPSGYDAQTGRDLQNYPPHRVVDHRHMKLEIDILDMNEPGFEAVQTLTVVPIAEPAARLTLNAALLDIRSVTVSGHETRFTNDGGTLEILFNPPLPVGKTTEIVTTYRVEDPPHGLAWTPETPAWPGRAAQLHTQGQPETNRYWFPCHDFPNERLTTELIVTVPAGFEVSSNGRLVERRSMPAAEGAGLGRERFHWLQDKPHANYLVSLVVGKFDVVDVGTADLPMPVYVPQGRGGDVEGTYGRTAAMVDLFAELVDEPYPWDRYAQLIVWNFGAGGMENTSATTMYDTAIFSEPTPGEDDLDGLIAHELAHQWFGDLITCNSWEHIWLNEGFATYFSQLWYERRDGRDAFQAAVMGSFDNVIANDRAAAPHQQGMASKVYEHPWDVFRREANPYPKGASVLHMLRQRVGDDLFFKSLAAYVDRHKYGNVETCDLRRVFEEVTGESLERFFTQWVYRPGVPELDVVTAWDASASELVVTVEQRQNIDDYNPAFALSLPLWVPGAAAMTVDVDRKRVDARFPLAAEPAFVAIDPELSVLASMTIHQPLGKWIAQLGSGPTLAARTRAARALVADDAPESAEALVRVALDGEAHKFLRVEAARALGRRGQVERLLNLLDRGVSETDVRVAAIEALAEAAEDDAREAVRSVLRRLAGPGASERTRVAAIRALGRLEDRDAVRTLVAATEEESQHDRIRQAALSALADLDVEEGLAAAIRCAQPGMYNRTRPTAIGAVARLAHHDPEAAFAALVPLVGDRERRAWEAAGRALVELGDGRAIESLETIAAAKRDPGDRRQVEGWIEQLERQASPEAAPAGSAG